MKRSIYHIELMSVFVYYIFLICILNKYYLTDAIVYIIIKDFLMKDTYIHKIV